MKEASKIKFDCNGDNAPAYGCDKPGDNSGVYVQSTDYDELLRERNELAAQVERLRGALYYLNKNTRMTNDKGVALSKIEAEEVLKETPAQSLEAVKREWKDKIVDNARQCADYGLGDLLSIPIDELRDICNES